MLRSISLTHVIINKIFSDAVRKIVIGSREQIIGSGLPSESTSTTLSIQEMGFDIERIVVKLNTMQRKLKCGG